MVGTGGVYEDLQQQMINDAMSRHQFEQMEPWQRLELYRSFIDGGLGGSSTQTTSATTPRRNLTGSVLAGAGLGALQGYKSDDPWSGILGMLTGALGAVQ